MTNPFLRKNSKHSIGASGRASEKKVLKRLGAQAKPASGAMQGAKGDGETKSFLVEAKSTVNDSLNVKLDWLAKIKQEAIAQGKSPVLTVTFTNGDGGPRKWGKWVMMEEHIFEQLMERDGEVY